MRSDTIISWSLMGLLAVVIATATMLEEGLGSAAARNLVYGSLWFKLLWGILAVSAAHVLWLRRLWKRLPVFLLHLSFLIILAGALLTSVTGKQGYIHLRQGIPTKEFICEVQGADFKAVEKFPFFVRLDSFRVAYYPGTEAPQDYISQVTIDSQPHTISMNHIVKWQGYRFFQSSFDEDLQGSILSINYDPYGTSLTYFGYALLGLSMMWVLFSKRKRLVGALLLAGSSLSLHALPVMPREDVARMERQQVMWNDRAAPMGTMSQELLLKIYGRRSYHGLSATEVVSSMMSDPRAWSNESIIKTGRGKYKSLSDFVDYSESVPRLKGLGHNAETDEKVGLMLMLMQGTLVKTLPQGVEPLSERRVSAELFYNHIDWTLYGMIICFLLTIVAGYAAFIKRSSFPFRYFLFPLLLFLLAGWCLRWYISGFIPLSNGYETMYFVAICLLVVPLFVPRTMFISFFSAAFVLLVAHLGEMSPRITPLMPVLHSPWLSAHVSIIMMSYALLVLSIVERRLLRLAVFFLSAGIFLGAVWANVSWGSYWSWDPKESWALITLIVYSVPLHEESLPWFRSTRNYRLYSLLALCCLLMTYFGVNYLLGGMHSYG